MGYHDRAREDEDIFMKRWISLLISMVSLLPLAAMAQQETDSALLVVTGAYYDESGRVMVTARPARVELPQGAPREAYRLVEENLSALDERVHFTARLAGKRLLIIADYDADGATACTVAVRGLRAAQMQADGHAHQQTQQHDADPEAHGRGAPAWPASGGSSSRFTHCMISSPPRMGTP